MAKKTSQQITLVGVRGAKLPVTECLLVNASGAEYVVQAVHKTKGRAPNKLRTYTLPKAMVQYYFADEDLASDAEVEAPVATAKKAAPKKATDAKAADAPKKRGRPKGSKKATDAKAADAPKKRGRPKGVKNKDAEATPEADAPKKRGRPKGVKNKSKKPATAAATDSRKASRAASLFDESF